MSVRGPAVPTIDHIDQLAEKSISLQERAPAVSTVGRNHISPDVGLCRFLPVAVLGYREEACLHGPDTGHCVWPLTLG